MYNQLDWLILFIANDTTNQKHNIFNKKKKIVKQNKKSFGNKIASTKYRKKQRKQRSKLKI